MKTPLEIASIILRDRDISPEQHNLLLKEFESALKKYVRPAVEVLKNTPCDCYEPIDGLCNDKPNCAQVLSKKALKLYENRRMKYFFNVVEEVIMNPEYEGYRGGRVEVHKEGEEYAIYEARFFLPEEFYDGFRELFDFKESDKPVMIKWDQPEDK